MLAVLLAPLVFLIPIEIVLAFAGVVFTEEDFVAPLDKNLQTMVMSEGELYRPKPGTWEEYLGGFRINSLGFREDEPTPKAEREYRVLALGDSMVFGLYVEEDHSWPHILERELQEKGNNVHVINMGRVATSSYGTLIDVQRYAELYDPDALVVSIGWFNDYQIIHEHPQWDERRAVQEEMFRADWERAHSVLQWSRVYRLWRGWYWKEFNERNQALTQEWFDEGRYDVGRELETRRVPIDQFRQNIQAICSWAKERDLPIFFTTPALNPNSEKQYPIVRVYAEAIRQEAAARGVPVIKTRELLLGLGESEPTNQIWLDYVHLTRKGNAILAGYIGGMLDRELPWIDLYKEDEP